MGIFYTKIRFAAKIYKNRGYILTTEEHGRARKEGYVFPRMALIGTEPRVSSLLCPSGKKSY